MLENNTLSEINSKMTFVRMAGSERISKTGATGMALREAQCIGLSLSGFGSVINSLAEESKDNKPKFVPYRNSKLTYILKDTLGLTNFINKRWKYENNDHRKHFS